eukprot:TRINITY_DN914_c4_g1_i2.p1 TRINITY_DN914_c4_g1~~TRINITY_DN914_c4_g1_i2.p1  ORF type:complete len:328 (+),score=141.83 TRINITY_DN914_c4_g1_i2:148-984(+)
MATAEQIDTLLEAAKETVKLPRGKKACKEAATEALEASSGDQDAAVTVLAEKFGVKKRKAAAPKAKKGEEGDADSAAPAEKKPKKAKAEAEAAPAVELPPLGEWTFDPTAVKETGVRLLAAARERGIKVPGNDDSALVSCGGLILGAKTADGSKVDADAVMKGLTDKYGSAALDAASKKKSKIETVVEANQPLVDLFREFAGIYFKQEGDAQKGATYQKAGTAIAKCEWEITLDALPHEKKGHERKLENVGKSSIAKVKEFLQTGTVAQLEELRANAV